MNDFSTAVLTGEKPAGDRRQKKQVSVDGRKNRESLVQSPTQAL
jgi:hypothetical protein